MESSREYKCTMQTGNDTIIYGHFVKLILFVVGAIYYCCGRNIIADALTLLSIIIDLTIGPLFDLASRYLNYI